MSSISFDLSGKIDQPTVNALSPIPFFVVGASARDKGKTPDPSFI